ncbi:MAG: hypothetical protein N4A72_23295 [Bacteroidales bacterium]|nr:hypothetical protein [Bacteroidales bacterium]
MNIPIWQYVASMSAYIIILLLMVEFMRKNIRFAAIFWILSLLTFPLWSEQLDGWFRWAKTVSVLIPTAILVGFGRLAAINNNGKLNIFKKDWILWALYAVLFINILEATLKDFATGNIYNGIAGAILCITIPLVKNNKSGKYNWTFTKEKPGDLLAFTSPAWNFLYTTWNLAFVFGENPGYFASSFCILMAAEFYPIIKKRPELYIIARVYTLAFHILIRATYDIFTPIMDSSSWANSNVLYWWGLGNVALHIPFIIWWAYRVYINRKSQPIIV